MRQPQQGERVIRERDGDGGDCAGRNDEHQRPTVQERGERSPRLAQIHVAAARAGSTLPQLAETECPDQRDAAADDPRQQHQPRRAQSLGDGGGRAKNPAADDPADYGHRSGEEAESAGVRRYLSDASNPA